MAKKLITKKMIKGLINLDDEQYGRLYQSIINDINAGTEVFYLFPSSSLAKDHNKAVTEILLVLLYVEKGQWSCEARQDMMDVMYKYNIGTDNTAEQNLRGIDWDCATHKDLYKFKLSADLNFGLNHFELKMN